MCKEKLGELGFKLERKGAGEVLLLPTPLGGVQ